jgi:deoxyribodipyrimidine photolyase-like uncharacterized protein
LNTNKNDSSTATDNNFVDSIRFSSSSTSPIVNGLSDHDAQYLMINTTAAAGSFTHLKQRIKTNNETITQFRLLLKSKTWESVYKDNDTNKKFNLYLYAFLNIFEASFSIKYGSTDKIMTELHKK